jgi:hypothetical protein
MPNRHVLLTGVNLTLLPGALLLRLRATAGQGRTPLRRLVAILR